MTPRAAGAPPTVTPGASTFEVENPVASAPPTSLLPGDDYPELFYCPITSELMTDPVIDPEGNSYERAAIEEWLGRSATSPVTRAPLAWHQLAPNRALKDAIERALADHRRHSAQQAAAPPVARQAAAPAEPREPPPVRGPVPKQVVFDVEGAVPQKLAKEMAKHGLTEADQQRLFQQEDVTDVKRFQRLTDENYPAEIDIRARREAKRQQDQQAAQELHDQAQAEAHERHDAAVQGARIQHEIACRDVMRRALVTAKLSDAEVIEAVLKVAPDIDALRELVQDRDTMADIGMTAFDRQQLTDFCRGKGQRWVMPTPQAVPPVEIVPPIEVVLTEPERVARQKQARIQRLDWYAVATVCCASVQWFSLWTLYADWAWIGGCIGEAVSLGWILYGAFRMSRHPLDFASYMAKTNKETGLTRSQMLMYILAYALVAALATALAVSTCPSQTPETAETSDSWGDRADKCSRGLLFIMNLPLWTAAAVLAKIGADTGKNASTLAAILLLGALDVFWVVVVDVTARFWLIELSLLAVLAECAYTFHVYDDGSDFNRQLRGLCTGTGALASILAIVLLGFVLSSDDCGVTGDGTCGENGSCVGFIAGTCACRNNTAGRFCEIQCGEHATAAPGVDDVFECTCDTGYIGERCETSCGPHGTSHDGQACTCDTGYIGALCQDSCGSHGTSYNGKRCRCDPGYSGNLCQIEPSGPCCSSFGSYHRDACACYSCGARCSYDRACTSLSYCDRLYPGWDIGGRCDRRC